MEVPIPNDASHPPQATTSASARDSLPVWQALAEGPRHELVLILATLLLKQLTPPASRPPVTEVGDE